jgi:hypothetical protein
VSGPKQAKRSGGPVPGPYRRDLHRANLDQVTPRSAASPPAFRSVEMTPEPNMNPFGAG